MINAQRSDQQEEKNYQKEKKKKEKTWRDRLPLYTAVKAQTNPKHLIKQTETWMKKQKFTVKKSGFCWDIVSSLAPDYESVWIQWD